MGDIIRLSCPNCGLNTGELGMGYGFSAKCYALVWCNDCKKFDTALVAKYKGAKEGEIAIPPVCPGCGQEVLQFNMEEKRCPVCEAEMEEELIGFWD